MNMFNILSLFVARFLFVILSQNWLSTFLPKLHFVPIQELWRVGPTAGEVTSLCSKRAGSESIPLGAAQEHWGHRLSLQWLCVHYT